MVHSSVYKKLLCGVEHPKKGRCVRGKQVQSLRGRENESERVESSPVMVMFNISKCWEHTGRRQLYGVGLASEFCNLSTVICQSLCLYCINTLQRGAVLQILHFIFILSC